MGQGSRRTVNGERPLRAMGSGSFELVTCNLKLVTRDKEAKR